MEKFAITVSAISFLSDGPPNNNAYYNVLILQIGLSGDFSLLATLSGHYNTDP